MSIIIGEVGSNHLGNLSRAKEFIHAIAEAGAQIAKFQLFEPEQFPHNIAIPESWTPELEKECASKGIGFLLSAFYFVNFGEITISKEDNKTSFEFGYSFPIVKIAYSQRHNFSLIRHFQGMGSKLIVSGDANTWWPKDCIKLACVPEYPSCENDYHFYESDYFDGISWHGVGIDYLLEKQPRWVEVHVKMGDEKKSPDAGSFAITPAELKQLVKKLNG